MNIVLVGLGVIGGSVGLSLRGKIYGAKIDGIDLDEETLIKAQELRIIENGGRPNTYDEHKMIEEADVVILSIYPSQIKSFIDRNAKVFKKGSIIVDTSGVKNHLVNNIVVPEGIDFVLTHPMAGREKSGIDFASRKVFIGANFIITRTDKNKDESIKTVKMLANRMGFSNIVETSVKLHDSIIAFTSQLPHAIAVSLVNSDKLDNTGSFTGDSYKEITRIANINENLWAELFFSNKENLLDKISDFENELRILKEAIKNEDEELLKEKFIAATGKRKQL